MAITLTNAAARQIASQLAKHACGLGLRVGVKPVGCSGLTYTYAITAVSYTHLDVYKRQAYGRGGRFVKADPTGPTKNHS